MKYLFNVFLLLVSLSLHAQFEEYLYGASGNDFIYDLVPAPDGNFYAIGAKQNKVREIWLMKINPLGQKIWEKTFPAEDTLYHENGYGVHINSDGSLLLFGEQMKTSGIIKRYALLLKTDANGNQIWRKKYTNVAYIHDLEISNDTLFMVGFYQPIGASNSGIFLMTDDEGNVLQRQEMDYQNQNQLQAILPTSDHQFILTGRSAEIGVGFAGIVLRKINHKGQVLWTKTKDTGLDPNFSSFDDYYPFKQAAMLGQGDSIFIAESYGNDNVFGFMKFSPQGNFVRDSKFGFQVRKELPQVLQVLDDNQFLIAGIKDDETAFVYKVNTSGVLQWKYYFESPYKEYAILTAASADNQILLGGHVIKGSGGGDDLEGWIKRIGTDGTIYGYTARIKVLLDNNANCVADQGDIPVPHMFVTIHNAQDVFQQMTDADGYFDLNVYDGSYDFTLHNPDTSVWEICDDNFVVVMGDQNVDTLLQFLMQQPKSCAQLELGLTQPDFVRCDTSCMTAMITNTGILQSEEMRLTLQNDPELTLISASRPFTETSYGYELQIPELGIFQEDRIQICYALDCDVQLGSTHNIEGSISPRTCEEPYSGPYFTVASRCENDKVVFSMQNKGGGGSGAGTFYNIYLNDQLVADHQWVTLPEGTAPTEFRFDANGKTWRMELDQDPNAPGIDRPSTTLESCGKLNTNLHAIGFRNAYRTNDQSKSVSVIQPQNSTGVTNRIAEAYKGYGFYNIVDSLFPLEYSAMATNLTQVVVNTAVFDLTLWYTFDMFSFRLVSSTYPAEIEIVDNEIIRVTMHDLHLLPGESVMFRFALEPFPDTPHDMGGPGHFRVQGTVSLDDGPSLTLRPAYQNYSTRSHTESLDYYVYPEEVAVYGGQDWDFGSYMIPAEAGKIFLGGISFNISASVGADAYIIKTDYNGKVDWYSTVPHASEGYTGLGGLANYGSGGCFYASRLTLIGTDSAIVHVGALDSEGHSIFDKAIRDPMHQHELNGFALLKTTDNNYVIYGIVQDSAVRPYYMKVNASGDLLWFYKDYSGGYHIIPYGGLATKDGGFLLIGMEYFGQDNILMKVDQNGNVLWKKRIFSADNPSLENMAEADNGDILIAGWAQVVDDTSALVTGVHIIRCNSNGVQLWEKRHVLGSNGAISTYITNIIKVPDGYLLTGDIFVNETDRLSDMLLMHIDEEGNVNWYKNYGIKNDESGNVLYNPDPNTILIFGNNQSRSVFGAIQALLVRTDNEGIANAIEDIEEENNNLSWLFPNPAVDQIQVLFDPVPGKEITWVVMDVMGRMLMAGKNELKSTTQIETAQLEPGTYFISFPGSVYPSKSFVVIR